MQLKYVLLSLIIQTVLVIKNKRNIQHLRNILFEFSVFSLKLKIASNKMSRSFVDITMFTQNIDILISTQIELINRRFPHSFNIKI